MKIIKDTKLEGLSQQANKDVINRRKVQVPKHLKFFLLVLNICNFYRVDLKYNIKMKYEKEYRTY